MAHDEEWVELCSTTADYEARLIEGLLESNGIPVQLKSYRVSQFPFDVGHIGEIKILVRADDLESAQAVLQEAGEEEGGDQG
ncbi:MAG: DUF2007 domain-containing protein [bacterium]